MSLGRIRNNGVGGVGDTGIKQKGTKGEPKQRTTTVRRIIIKLLDGNGKTIWTFNDGKGGGTILVDKGSRFQYRNGDDYVFINADGEFEAKGNWNIT